MIAITFLVSLVGSALVFALPPVSALLVYAWVLLYYPQQLTISLGRIDFNSGRIVVLALFAAFMLRKELVRKFKWNLLDTLVLLAFGGQTFGYLFNVPVMRVIEARGGNFIDTILPYFAVRLIVHDRKSLYTFLRVMVLMAIPLVALGWFESLTGQNPLDRISGSFNRDFGGSLASSGLQRSFFGVPLYRATGTFGIHISFGLYFSVLVPMCLAPWFKKEYSRPMMLGAFCIMGLGALSSMSSAPMLSIFVSCAMIACFALRRFWIPMTIVILLCFLFVEIYSESHFWWVLNRLTLESKSGTYRIGLIDEALTGGMRDHWLAGYGFVGVVSARDNQLYGFLWSHIDLVNIYIFYLARTGLVGLLPFMAFNAAYYRRLYQAAKASRDVSDQWFVWCFAAGLVGWNAAMMTVGPLSQTLQLLHILAAVACNLPLIMADSAAAPERLTVVESRRRRMFSPRRQYAAPRPDRAPGRAGPYRPGQSLSPARTPHA